jgi:hypothetical protein
MLKKSLALAAAAVVAGVMALSGAGTANAARPIFIPRMGGMGIHQPITHSAMMGGSVGGTHTFHGGDSDWWRRRHHHDRDFAFLGFGFPAYDDDYYYPSYGYGYAEEAHVQWCFDHYRTYNPRTNSYIGSDGYRHACIGRYY